jgi:acetyl esterase/lipase
LSSDILTEPPPPDADCRIAYGPEPLQFGDLRVPRGTGPHPLVVLIHGGFWQAIYNLTHAGHVCVDLSAHGIASWNVEYRRIGDPGGGWSATLDDVRLALAYVHDLAAVHSIDANRVVIVGHSAGAQLALLAAMYSQLPVRGVISLAGVVDPAETAARGHDRGLIARFLRTNDPDSEVWRVASPRAQVPLGLSYVIACGTDDALWDSNEAMADAARAAGDDARLVALPGAGHFELIDPQAREWAQIRSEIQRLL